MELIETLSQNFFDAFYMGKFLGNTSLAISDLSLNEAYLVQDKVIEKRKKRGETIVGYKVGCTSSAIQDQLGLKEPIYGRLLKPYFYREGTKLFWNDYVNCAIEPEMVLKIGKDIEGENLSNESLIEAIEYVSPGIEIHNFTFWFSPITSQELICSNGMHAGVVVGDSKVSPNNLSFGAEIFKVFKNGKLITKASASEIMGGPLFSLRWLVRCLTRKNQFLNAGSFVIPGSPIKLIKINEDMELMIEIDRVGSVTTKFINT